MSKKIKESELLKRFNKDIVSLFQPFVGPSLYVFDTPLVDSAFLKVGYSATPNKRILYWNGTYIQIGHKKTFKVMIDPEKNIFVQDHAFHQYFKEHGYENLSKKDFLKMAKECKEINIKNPHYSKEFFKLGKKWETIINEAYLDICDDWFNNGGIKYTYYTWDAIAAANKKVKHNYERGENWKLRGLQQEVIDNFLKFVDKNKKNKFLLSACCRFGKTFVALECAEANRKRLNKKTTNVLIMTAQPGSVEEEWRKTVAVCGNYKNYTWIDKEALELDSDIIKKENKNGKSVIIFASLQGLFIDGKRIETKWSHNLLNTYFDTVLIDEAHFGTHTDNLGKIVNSANKSSRDQEHDEYKLKEKCIDELCLKRGAQIHLSATPYRDLLSKEFSEEDKNIIGSYTRKDLFKADKEWLKKHPDKFDYESPYFGMPELRNFIFELTEEAQKIMQENETDISKIFELTKDNTKWKNPSAAHSMLGVLFGAINDKNVPAAFTSKVLKDANIGRHIMLLFSREAACDLAEKELLKFQKKDDNILKEYKIINVAGTKENWDVANYVAEINKCARDKQKTISLTCQKFTTGTTIEPLDTIVFLRSTQSAEWFTQASGRIVTPYVRDVYTTDGEKTGERICEKPYAAVIDFDKNRQFAIRNEIAHDTKCQDEQGGLNATKRVLAESLEEEPILLFEGELKTITATDIMKHINDYSGRSSKYTDICKLTLDESIFNNIPNLSNKLAKYGALKLSGDVEYILGYEESDDNAGDKKDKANDNESSKDTKNKDNKDIKDKKESETLSASYLRSLFNRLGKFATLSSWKSKDGTKVPNSFGLIIAALYAAGNKKLGINTDEVRLIKHLELTDIDLTKEIYDKYDWYYRDELDKYFWQMYALGHSTDISLEERIELFLKQLNKISDTEVTTPQNACDVVLNKFSKKQLIKCIKNGGKILDISARAGEFAWAIYKLLINEGLNVEEFANSIYSICTSKMAYEFTYKIYKDLGLNTDCILSKHTSEEFVKLPKNKQELLCYNNNWITGNISDIKERGEQLKFDFVVGNPPYNSSNSKYNIWPKFIECGTSISDYSSFIHPARWIKPKAQMVKTHNMILNNGLKLFDLYQDPNEVFGKSCDSSGGVTITLFKKGYNGKIKYYNKGIYQWVYDKNKIFFLDKYEKEAYNKVAAIFPNFDNMKSKTIGRIGATSTKEYGYDKNNHIQYLSTKKKNNNYIPIWASKTIGKQCKNDWYYIDKNHLNEIDNKITSSRKVMISKTGHALIPNKSTNIINNIPIIAPKNATSVGSVFFVFPEKDDKKDLDFIVALFKTKTIRFLMSITQKDMYVRGFENVPNYTLIMNKLNKNTVTDEDLYKLFNFSQELIDYIESHISAK